MPTIQVGPGSDLELQLIADALAKSKKAVVVTGAGISTNCGIPDFRSENGLYSLIQAQYDAALKNPPWEESNTFDIDDRPKKKRRQWYYEVVAPDGKVVDVIDEEIQAVKEETRETSSGSTNTTNSRSSSSKPVDNSLQAPNSQLSISIDQDLQTTDSNRRRSSRSRSVNESINASQSTESSVATAFVERIFVEDLPSSTQEPRRSSRSRSVNASTTRSQSTESSIPTPVAEAILAEGLPLSTEPRRSSRSRFANSTTSQSITPQPIEPFLEEEATRDQSVDIKEELHLSKEDIRRSSRSRSTNTTNSRSSTPKSTESSLTSLSSTTPELPATSFQDSSQLSFDIDQSTLSQTTENGEPSTQTSSVGSTSLSRTTSDLSSRTLPNLKGRDLFDSRIWASPFETSIFYMFISSLRDKIQAVESPTETHKFLRVLRDGGKLVRNYTQNIDLLEQREGLCQDLEKGPGSKARFNPKAQKEARQSGLGGSNYQHGGCESVPLHGSLQRLRCNLCGKPSSWDEPATRRATQEGSAPDCSRCTENNSHRTSRGRRGVTIGRLRPDIVLYGEDHPHDTLISAIAEHDLSLGPDVLLIMGTSLRVHGLKIMVREFAKAVHTKGGKVVFVNQTKPSESIWGEFIDYWVEWDCDEWVLDLRDRREDIWMGAGEEKYKESAVETKRRPQCVRDDRTNGVYLTFKILDTLSKAPDGNGKPASRFPYWQSRLASRVSDVSVIQKKEPPKKAQPTKATKKSAPPKKPAPPKAKNNKRKAEPKEDINNLPSLVSTMWEDLRKKAPGLPVQPPELRLPLSKALVNAPDWYQPFAFSGSSNHIPNVGGSSWPLDKMNLVTQPPSGYKLTKPKIEGKPKIDKKPKTKHGYGTRASGRFSTAETIVVDSGDIVEEPEDTIVVAEEPMTPATRIKRSCSIGALVSSSPEQWHDAPEVMT
ncbi:DHS-like NAD/FAD-binding domain-containing protein [Mollisia scopiformis]|uniref:DHS-like NAD/FAD-binding domain-containing protein n=1 Tax=Mollisia scopiformis TaxID=149040 RepID=A0A194X8V4_MOLSC|nr:DHS-like NAD/FAD-binding domain-containing protein [Mollisia scopiformis]KUJ16601.1 DHS-like NAD/FAD-binding domain-containing protein [Mollisia scopiformis]